MEQAKIAHAEKIRKLRQLRQQQQVLRKRNLRVVVKNGIGPISGLVNIGNTCYMNSVLQCLRHSNLCKYLLGKGFAQDKVCFTNRSPVEQGFLAEIRNLMINLENDQKTAQRPVKFLKMLAMFNKSFAGFQQADAQECLDTILQTLHNALRLNVTISVNQGKGNSKTNDKLRKALSQYESHLNHGGYSVIDELFGSQFESKLTCLRCGHIWVSYDPYCLVPVEIPAKAISLYDCLDQFMKTEELEEVTCENCSKQHGKTTVHKQFRLWTLPKILVIQLKRFNGNHAGVLRKFDKFVQAPLKLNITKYVSHPKVVSQVNQNPAALQLYNLKSMICHSGQLRGGHYTAKCFRDGEGWFEINDDYSRKITNANELQSSLNYIFFYEISPETNRWWG